MSAVDVVARQLHAYNDRDLDAFMACWTPDASILAWPDTLLAEGAEAIRVRHGRRFAEPYLHACLLSRIAIGDMVVDQERVTRDHYGRAVEVEVIAIYEVRDGLIHRAWFRQDPAL